MKTQNFIVHEHPDSEIQATIPIPETGEAAVEKMRIIAGHLDASGFKIDQRIDMGFGGCDFIETCEGHMFSTNHYYRVTDIQA